jgi:hypothetical protein
MSGKESGTAIATPTAEPHLNCTRSRIISALNAHLRGGTIPQTLEAAEWHRGTLAPERDSLPCLIVLSRMETIWCGLTDVWKMTFPTE